MFRSPVIAAWIAGGVVWGVAMVGLGAMGGPQPLGSIPEVTQHDPRISAEMAAEARERALDGDPWGDADLHSKGGYYLPAAAPDS